MKSFGGVGGGGGGQWSGRAAAAAAAESRYRGGSMALGRRPTGDKIEVVTTF